jgi:hypothetical protein
MSPSEPARRRRCSGCGALSPKTQWGFVLFMQRYGWSAIVEKQGERDKVAEWRCADCRKLTQAST